MRTCNEQKSNVILFKPVTEKAAAVDSAVDGAIDGAVALAPAVPVPAVIKCGRIYDKPESAPRRADPIRDPATLRAILEALRATGKHGPRNEMIFKLGVASGRRCGDVLNLQVREVWNAAQHNVQSGIRYWDQKTRRWLAFYLDDNMRAELAEYLRAADVRLDDPDAYIFPSQKGAGPMSTTAYGKILRKVAEKLNLSLHLATHSMRKTFGYMGFRANGSEFVTDALGHYNEKNTLTYLGLDAEYLRQGYDKLQISALWAAE